MGHHHQMGGITPTFLQQPPGKIYLPWISMDTSSSIFKRGFQPSSADYIPARYYFVPVFADFIQHLAGEGGKFPHFLSDSFHLCLAFSVMAFMIADYLVVMHQAWPPSCKGLV